MPERSTRVPRPWLRRAVYAVFGLSGATALVYETVWARHLVLTFGASHEAVATVLASFMAGLALGGVVLGRWAERSRRPLRLYAVVELALALSAAATPALHRLADGLYLRRALEADGVPPELQVLRVALAFLVLLPPTFLMGGTLPILVQLFVRGQRQMARYLPRLYAVNTAGAVAGTLGAAFVLLPRLGMSRTLAAAVAVNLAVALVAWTLDRAVGERATTSDPEGESRDPSPRIGARSGFALRLAYYGTAVSGLTALALEVLWMRGITVASGNTAYSFSVMLAAFLVGIAAGSWLLGSRWPEVDPARLFGLAMVGIGLTAAIVTQLMPRLPYLALVVNRWLYDSPAGVRAGATLGLSFAVMLVPCLLMGVAFPAAGRAASELRERWASSAGNLVALNTAGSIVGSLAAGFWLIPRLGLQRSMLLCAAVNLTWGLLVLAVRRAEASARPWRVLLPAAGLGGVALALPSLAPAWDLRPLAVFRNNAVVGSSVEAFEEIVERSTVLYYREGAGANVSVVEGTRARAIVIDGKTVATDGMSDMQHELLLGHLPVLAHPRPRSVAIIGLGAGITLGAVLAHEEPERVLAVEIEPAVVDGARLFAHVNGRALDDPRLEVVFQDGRNHLLTSRERFDVITADPIHPWARGAAYLYTNEYYELAAGRLTNGGVMCQWLPLYELSLDNVRAAVASFADVFPHTQVWQTAHDAILLGSSRPLEFELDDLARRLAQPRVRRHLVELGLDEPLSLLAELTLEGDGLARFVSGARRNTDDNLYLEFSSPLSVARGEMGEILAAFARERSTFLPAVSGRSAAAGEALAARAKRYRAAKERTVQAQVALRGVAARGDLDGYAAILEELRAVAELTPGYGRTRSVLVETLLGAAFQNLALGRTEAAFSAFFAAVEVMPDHAVARHHLATALSEHGRLTEALPHFEGALAGRPGYPAARLNLGVTLLRLGRHLEALAHLEAASELRPADGGAHLMLATAQALTGRSAEAFDNFRRAESLEPRTPGLHANYAGFLVAQRVYGGAVEVLERGLEIRPDDPVLKEQLVRLLAAAPDDATRRPSRARQIVDSWSRAAEGGLEEARWLDLSAMAAAAEGDYERAVADASRAEALARQHGQAALGAEIARRRDGYQLGQPYRLP